MTTVTWKRRRLVQVTESKQCYESRGKHNMIQEACDNYNILYLPPSL